jgi:alpha-tubulin suppressor-like RCC1 family protein
MKITEAGAAALLLFSLPACQDQPVTSGPGTDDPAPLIRAELRCEANVLSATFACRSGEGGGSSGVAGFTLITVGGQHHYVRLTNTGIVVDAGAGTFTTTVTVQNLLLAAMGTEDASTPHAAGVRVFFASGPTNGVTVANATGQGFFLGAGQDYFQYSGHELGADGLLSPDEASAGKPWTFHTDGASSFSFTVYVQAAVPAGVDPTAHFSQVSGGYRHTCALTPDGRAYCWGRELGGDNIWPEIDLGVPSAVEMPNGVRFTRIASGFRHTCALGTDDRSYCWGTVGQLGSGTTTEDQLTPSEVEMPPGVSFSSLAAGYSHTCALGSDDRAYCWGWNRMGQLGNGTTLPVDQPSPSQVAVPAGVTFFSIAGGYIHTCALTSDGRAYCWGSDQYGQLGNGTAQTTDQPSPFEVEMPAGVSFSSIAAGYGHTCALGSDGRAYCWGWDLYGQLGNGATLTADQPAPAPVEMPAGLRFTSITVGFAHTCALGSDGRAYCWGSDDNGQLGNGSTVTANQPSPSPVGVPAGEGFTSIHAGNLHTCAWSSGPAYCWGWNWQRQVGDGTDIDRAAPVRVAGTK